MNYFLRIAAAIFILLPLFAYAQFIDGKFVFPDITGYYTLKCDFHMHTVFSDGAVWPGTRVREAVNEGLDAIAITEHLEYWPHKDHLTGDHSSSYEIAKPYADKNGLILIRACEITKAMPPGHFNFLFIKDANAIDSVDWKKAIFQANEQGAFTVWNHPGWRQEDEIPIWYDEHSWLRSQGLIQGIEIVNENSYYPLAHQWALDSNLCILGNSDIHDPIDLFFSKAEGEHRPITLVFAIEKTAEGIREALDNGRTAVFYKNMVFGDEWFLRELFYASIAVPDEHILEADDTSEWETIVTNVNSSMSFHLEMLDTEDEEEMLITLEPMGSVGFDRQDDDLHRRWKVSNLYTAPGKNLVIDYIRPY